EATGPAQAEAPAPAVGFMLASAGDTRLDSGLLFSPRPTYATPIQRVAVEAAPAPQPRALAPAVAAPVVKADARIDTKVDTKPETKAAAPAPPKKPAARKKENGELFNDAQLASIKHRLKLTESQEQYWPGVENALRAIGRAVAHNTPSRTTALGYASESRLAQIDPDGPEVQQLK